ncbi:MAG: GldG family protein [candidate division NC10 bacterium]|nr:GldG family protein [candidate division NC10 bacterium]
MKRFGMIAWIPGLALLAAGGLAYLFRPDWATWAGLLALVGAGLLAAWAYVGFDAILAVLGRRATRYGLNVTLSVLLLLALLVLVELISTSSNKRLDLSEGKRYTLSDQTIKILKNLKADVKAVAFYRPPSPNAFEDRRGAEELLRRYADLSTNFRYEFVDPDRDPGRAQRYKVSQYGSVVLEAKTGGGSDDKAAAPREQTAPTAARDAAPARTSPAPARTSPTPAPEKPVVSGATLQEEQITDLDEEKLTNAIIKVTRGGRRVMYFVVGHGERAITDSGKDGYNAIRTLVEKANYETRELLLLRETSVPADASVVVIAGPRKDFAGQELATLKDYVRRGGKLLALLDPDQAASLKPFLLQYGIKVGDDAVIDVDPTSTLYGGSELAPVVSRYSTFHPITRDFKNVATIFPLTRSVDTTEKTPEGVSLEKLAQTGPQSFRGKLNQGQVRVDPRTDQKESVPIAVIATVETTAPDKAKGEGKGGDEKTGGEPPKPVKARIVAFGSSSFAANNYVGAFGNRDLFMNTVSWLAEEESLISIRPREAKSAPIFLTAGQATVFRWVPVGLIPLAIAVVGSTVWIRRRRSR